MSTEVINIDQDHESGYRDAIDRGARVMQSGGLVAFPTETVYGLGVRADRPEAVRRLRAVKGGDDRQPFTVHIGRRRDVEQFAPGMPPVARRLIRKAWPGPLTLLLNVDDPGTAPIVSEHGPGLADQLYLNGAIGLRCPDERSAADLLNEVGPPVVASSANVPGGRPARSAGEVLEQMTGRIDLLLDGGPTRHAMPSTVVHVAVTSAGRTTGSPAAGFTVVREGVYDERALRRLAGVNILFVCTGNTCRSPMAAGLCRKLLADRLGCEPHELERHGFSVSSAGTGSWTGGRAATDAVDVLRERGVDIAGHTTQPLTEALAEQADVIYAMTDEHVESILALSPEASERIQRLAGESDIEDPIGASRDVYAACADQIEASLRRRLAEIEL